MRETLCRVVLCCQHICDVVDSGLMKLPTRHVVIQVRVTPAEKVIIRRLAREKRLKMSAYVRAAALAFQEAR